MNRQNINIINFNSLYEILDEIKQNLSFSISKYEKEIDLIKYNKDDYKDSLIVTKNFDSINNVEKNSLDFYASVKSLYLQDRQQKILNSKKIVNTQDDSDWEEIQN